MSQHLGESLILVDVSDIFFARGGRRGSPRRQGRGGGGSVVIQESQEGRGFPGVCGEPEDFGGG